jgi:hypothetical protein
MSLVGRSLGWEVGPMVDRHPVERKRISEYVESQLRPDGKVTHAELMSTEKVMGTRYQTWDVHTASDGRWWVVDPPTNLYSADDFKSMDVMLSFHIGLMQRVFDRHGKEPPVLEDEEERIPRAWRQWRQATKAFDEAEEAEDFQAVGMRCREALLSFIHEAARDKFVRSGQTAPKRSDFIHWGELIVDVVAAGRSASHRRSYLKSLVREAWEYVAWLTHARNAVPSDAVLAIEATGHTLTLLGMAIVEHEKGGPDRCPECGSYRILGDGWLSDDGSVWESKDVCASCDWESEVEREVLPPLKERLPPEGECLLTTDSISSTLTLGDYLRRQ